MLQTIVTILGMMGMLSCIGMEIPYGKQEVTEEKGGSTPLRIFSKIGATPETPPEIIALDPRIFDFAPAFKYHLEYFAQDKFEDAINEALHAPEKTTPVSLPDQPSPESIYSYGFSNMPFKALKQFAEIVPHIIERDTKKLTDVCANAPLKDLINLTIIADTIKLGRYPIDFGGCLTSRILNNPPILSELDASLRTQENSSEDASLRAALRMLHWEKLLTQPPSQKAFRREKLADLPKGFKLLDWFIRFFASFEDERHMIAAASENEIRFFDTQTNAFIIGNTYDAKITAHAKTGDGLALGLESNELIIVETDGYDIRPVPKTTTAEIKLFQIHSPKLSHKISFISSNPGSSYCIAADKEAGIGTLILIERDDENHLLRCRIVEEFTIGLPIIDAVFVPSLSGSGTLFALAETTRTKNSAIYAHFIIEKNTKKIIDTFVSNVAIAPFLTVSGRALCIVPYSDTKQIGIVPAVATRGLPEKSFFPQGQTVSYLLTKDLFLGREFILYASGKKIALRDLSNTMEQSLLTEVAFGNILAISSPMVTLVTGYIDYRLFMQDETSQSVWKLSKQLMTVSSVPVGANNVSGPLGSWLYDLSAAQQILVFLMCQLAYQNKTLDLSIPKNEPLAQIAAGIPEYIMKELEKHLGVIPAKQPSYKRSSDTGREPESKRRR